MNPGISAARSAVPRCFHGWRRCPWCGWPLRKPKPPKLRCAVCGRFRPGPSAIDVVTRMPIETCDRCRARGFEALTLF